MWKCHRGLIDRARSWAVVNVANMVHRQGGRDQSGPYHIAIALKERKTYAKETTI